MGKRLKENDRWVHGTTFRMPAVYLDAVREASEREGVPQREVVAEVMNYRANALDMPGAIQHDPGETLKLLADATGRSNVAEAAISIDLWLRENKCPPVRHLHPDHERWTERN